MCRNDVLRILPTHFIESRRKLVQKTFNKWDNIGFCEKRVTMLHYINIKLKDPFFR